MIFMEETQNNHLTLEPARISELVEEAILDIACELRADYRAVLEAAAADTRDRHETELADTRDHLDRASDTLDQLVQNAHIAHTQKVPLCQDTGYVWVLLKVGGGISVPAQVFSLVDAAVARAYEQAHLRKSLVHDALGNRTNTGDNTPAFCEVEFVSSEVPYARLSVMLKGGGTDNASQLIMLPPSEGIKGVCHAVLDAVQEKGASACPPLVVGVGVGSTFDKVAGLAKRALLREVGSIHPNPDVATLEAQLLEAINGLGIGPSGFGGFPTALAVHINTAPCHMAALPVAVHFGCYAMRSKTIDLLDIKTDKTMFGAQDAGHRESRPREAESQSGEQGLKPQERTSQDKRLDLPATKEQLAVFKAGDKVVLYGTIYTMRDAGHTRALDHLETQGVLPFDLKGQALFYAGPAGQAPSEVAAGQARKERFTAIGPTTASRMDFATPQFLEAGITVTLGKGKRAQTVIDACARTGSVYLAATGGAAAYLAQFVTAAELIAWDDLGPEALYRLSLHGLPAYIAIDATGATLWDEEA